MGSGVSSTFIFKMNVFLADLFKCMVNCLQFFVVLTVAHNKMGSGFSSTFHDVCSLGSPRAFWRKIQELGLVNAYNHHRGIQRLVRKVSALGCLPVVLVRHNFTTLRDSAQAQRVIKLYPAVGDFLAYIADT